MNIVYVFFHEKRGVIERLVSKTDIGIQKNDPIRLLGELFYTWDFDQSFDIDNELRYILVTINELPEEKIKVHEQILIDEMMN